MKRYQYTPQSTKSTTIVMSFCVWSETVYTKETWKKWNKVGKLHDLGERVGEVKGKVKTMEKDDFSNFHGVLENAQKKDWGDG